MLGLGTGTNQRLCPGCNKENILVMNKEKYVIIIYKYNFANNFV